MRRIVTGHDSEGRSVVVSDGAHPRNSEYRSVPGLAAGLAWATESGQPANKIGTDPTADVVSLVPGPGGTRLLTMVIPPDAVMAAPGFDPQAFVAEHLQNMPGLAELFEPDGMHTSPTVDYSFVLEGEVWLETDGGKLTRVQAGDIVVQNATRHGWRNKSDKPAVIAAVLIGTANAGES